MTEIDEKALKTELDGIVKNIDAIMKRVEAAVPAADPADPPPQEDGPDRPAAFDGDTGDG
jgi:hypothetical protein